MGFQPRKLLSDSNDETPSAICDGCYCASPCVKSCDLCHYHGSHTKKPLIITFALLAAAFLVLCCYVYYVRRFRRRRSNVRTGSQPETTEIRDEFLDEDHGPVVDHHIWYINTVGLQPSIINSIAVCKYIKGEGLVEGTECAVCLTEFEEDETLRLLPKCSHAFHVPCIDTWLRSHTNCPMCRAPIVSNTVDKGPSSSSEVNTEGTQVVFVEDEGQSERETEGGTSEIRIRPEEEDELAVEIDTERNTDETSGLMRRSVSLDSMAASQISQALAKGVPEGSNGDSDNELLKGKESSERIVSSRAAGNQSLLRLMCHSSIGRSLPIRPNFMKRSFSCNGKFTLPISNNKSRNANPPVRSF